jgi:regulatory protein
VVHFEPADEADGGALAPVAYLPGVVPASAGAAPAGADSDAAAERAHAEKVLLQRLRGRSLSTREARTVLKGTDIGPDEAEEIIERFSELHYIDEEKLAEQIIYSHHERKGLGRTGVEAEMRRRGLDAAVMLDKLEELPDDEVERAIELACKRVRQLERLDDPTIDRRLTGFLMRKGYASGSVRLAVKAALASRSGGGSGVRFR